MKIHLERLFRDRMLAVVLLLCVGCVFLSAVVPPLKSPDEHAHVARAYLLSKGVILLDHAEGESSGGYIDAGLMEYFERLPSVQDKLSQRDLDGVGELRWTGERVYVPAPGTGYYFPAVYLPHAVGLAAGELLDLTIDSSYRLARLLALLAAGLLLYAAFKLAPPNPLAIGLLVMPMSVYQFASASLDGVAIALALLVISLFVRIAREREATSNRLLYMLAASLVILASSRIHTLPMLLLLVAGFFHTRNRIALYLFAGSTVLVLSWTLLAIVNTVDLRVVTSHSTASVVLYYLQHPLRFLEVLANTLTNGFNPNFYFMSFIGILGWLDAPFSRGFYTATGIILLVIALLTASPRVILQEWTQRAWLIAVAVMSVLFVFFALLVAWTPHPANEVVGVQGRYFLIPMLVLAYGIAGVHGLSATLKGRLGTMLSLTLFVVSITASTVVLIQRYYVTPLPMATIAYAPEGQDGHMTMSPGERLSESEPVVLHLPPLEAEGFDKVTEVGILFGTYMQKNPGSAELVLRTADGSEIHQVFSLPELRDNTYRYFEVPPDYYVSGEIRALSGGGVSVFESNGSDGSVITCTKLLTRRNEILTIDGCK